ncbi:MAG: glutathione S-transferase family protein [Alphaproteobacteria bacterium]
MGAKYRIFGSELSPYSVKVRSYFRYKGLPHEWILRRPDNLPEFQKYAKLPLIPLVVTPEDRGIQDSTPIIETVEAAVPEPSIQPADPALAFVSALIEEYGDEWCNKPMFHYRWWAEADQRSAGGRIAASQLPDGSVAEVAAMADKIVERMVPRLSFVGSSPATRGTIEASLDRLLAILKAHLAGRPYLLGGRPALADFGLYAQLYECLTDPTAGELVSAAGTEVTDWIERMLEPQAIGEWEDWATLSPTLLPLLRQEIAGVFLPWSDANARALAAGEESFTVELDGKPFTQATQRYHARSLGVLRRRYVDVDDKGRLDSILAETGCLRWLTAA